MTSSDLVKELILSYNKKDDNTFFNAVRKYIEREKFKKHNLVAKELEKALYTIGLNTSTPSEKLFKNETPIPRDTEKGFPLLEIQYFDFYMEDLILSEDAKNQIEQIIKEFKCSDILDTYNLQYKKKILLCGKPGTGKTFSAQIVSSILHIPLVYIRFDAIISSYLGETASNLRKVFDFIQNDIWIVLFDEFDIIGKNRDDIHEHGEIKRVVNNFLQMLDNYSSKSIIFAATNHQHILDNAIWRRFDDVIYYELPNKDLRKQLFRNYFKPIKRSDSLSIDYFATQTEGLTPSDIKMIAENSIKLAIINSKDIVEQEDIEFAIQSFLKREKIKNKHME